MKLLTVLALVLSAASTVGAAGVEVVVPDDCMAGCSRVAVEVNEGATVEVWSCLVPECRASAGRALPVEVPEAGAGLCTRDVQQRFANVCVAA